MIEPLPPAGHGQGVAVLCGLVGDECRIRIVANRRAAPMSVVRREGPIETVVTK